MKKFHYLKTMKIMWDIMKILPVCSKVFITKDNLLNHEESVHARNNKAIPKVQQSNNSDKLQTRQFQRENCGKSFNSKDNYNLHLTIHMKKIHGNQILYTKFALKVSLLSMIY